MQLNTIHNIDCLIGMEGIPDKTIDLILCDLPQNITKNKWDVIIPFDKLWSHYLRIIKDNGAIVLFANQPFTTLLVASMPKLFRYSMVWQKTSASGFLNAKKMPLRAHEDIIVFYKKPPIYNPQKTTGHPRKVSTASHKRNCVKTGNYGNYNLASYDSTERYPTSILKFKHDRQHSALHPTQKPVSINKHFILTYTNEGAICLDNCSGSGSMAVACIETNRNYICFEADEKYFNDSIQRIASLQNKQIIQPAA